MRTMLCALTALSLASLTACGPKQGKDGSDGQQTGIHISYISEKDVKTCPDGKGGIRVESYYDANRNDVKDEGEKVIEDASHVDCYKKTYKNKAKK